MIPLENLNIIIPIGVFLIFLTVLLVITSSRNETKKEYGFHSRKIKVLNVKIDIITLIYFLLFFMMVCIGLLSNFLVPTIIGGVFALIPFLLLFYVENKKLWRK